MRYDLLRRGEGGLAALLRNAKVYVRLTFYLTFVVYFNQLLGATCTQKLVETFFRHFSTFFVYFKAFSVISQLKSTKNI